MLVTRGMASGKRERRAQRKERRVSKQAKLIQHRRSGHISDVRMKATAESVGVSGLTYHGPVNRMDCSCPEMNAKKAPFKHHATTRSKVRGERIHSDVKEVGVASKRGAIYAVCFVDDCTREGKTYCMQRKSQVLEKWQQFLEEELLSKGFACKYFRSDNGGEYIGELAAFNNCRGIEAEYSPPHCQSGNGVAEVFWRETFKIVRALSTKRSFLVGGRARVRELSTKQDHDWFASWTTSRSCMAKEDH